MDPRNERYKKYLEEIEKRRQAEAPKPVQVEEFRTPPSKSTSLSPFNQMTPELTAKLQKDYVQTEAAKPAQIEESKTPPSKSTSLSPFTQMTPELTAKLQKDYKIEPIPNIREGGKKSKKRRRSRRRKSKARKSKRRVHRKK